MRTFHIPQLTRVELLRAKASAQSLQQFVRDAFIDGGMLGPSDVWMQAQRAGRHWPLTSVRAQITILTDDGVLKKTGQQRQGMYGRPEGLWELA